MPEERIESFCYLLSRRAGQQADRTGYVFLRDGETESGRLTYAELDARARALATSLVALGAAGERVLLLVPPGPGYVAALFACFYAGAVAVPAYPPRLHRPSPRLGAIAADARPAVALAPASFLARSEALLRQTPELAAVRWLAVEEAEETGEAAESLPGWSAAADDLALLQYTSGSTAEPRGIRLGHGQLLSNSEAIRERFGHSPESVGVIWLPPYHDMGLIGGIFQPLFAGFPVVLMPPAAFVQAPVRWLRAISRYRATTSGGPDFAYGLCVRKVAAEERSTLDLSSWRVAFNGAEPIRARTLEEFSAAFSAQGFRREAFLPCYGLAEATLMVSGGPAGRDWPVCSVLPAALEEHRVEEVDAGGRVLVGSGRPAPETRVEIVDPATAMVAPPGRVGEIWVASPSVGQGYWGRAADEVFAARLASGNGPFLRTGDLGFLRAGELFVTGRLKDLVVLRGRNHYPQDLERTVEGCHPALRQGAAFTVEVAGEERLVVVHEVDRSARRLDLEAVAAAVRRAVAAEHGLQVATVVLLPPGGLPQTSSGKVRRQECRARFLAGVLEPLAVSLPGGEAEADEPPAAPEGADPEERLAAAIGRIAARAARVPGREAGLDRPMADLGLDSLAAVEACHGIASELGVSVSPALLLEGRTPREIAAAALRAPTTAEAPPALDGESGEIPLGIGQRAIWFHHLLAPEAGIGNLARAFVLAPSTDLAALRRALERLAERHPALRSTFGARDGEPYQTVHAALPPAIHETDASAWTAREAEEHLERLAATPFDLERGPLLRVELLRRRDGGTLLAVLVHHLITDFWSLSLLAREMGATYRALREGEDLAPAAAAPGVGMQTAWEEGERLWDYWRRELAGPLTPARLPADRPRQLAPSFHGARRGFHLGPDLAAALRRLARAEGATLFTVLLAAFAALLARLSRDEDVVLGAPFAGRTRPELAGVVGCFVNLAALRLGPRADLPFRGLLGEARRTVLGALAHQEFPFPLVVERLRPERTPGAFPLFQTLFALQQGQAGAGEDLAALALGVSAPTVSLDGLELTPHPVLAQPMEMDLALMTASAGDGLAAVLEYRTELFDPPTIHCLQGRLAAFLAGVAADPGCPLGEVGLLSEAERHQAVREWNDTAAALSGGEEDVVSLFAAWAERSPEAPALVCGDCRWTYGELAARVDALARRLRAAGVGPEVRVGVALERSPELVVGLLAVLAAGGVYVPLAPSEPPARLKFLLADCRAALLLAPTASAVARSGALPVLDPAEYSETGRPGLPERWGRPLPASLAYVLYTSGSTGTPKGAMNTHGALANRLLWMQERYRLEPGERVLHKTPIGFDVSVWELLWPLAAGAVLVVAPPGVHGDPAALACLLRAARVSTVHFVPSMLRVFLEEADLSGLGPLRRVIASGEALTAEVENRFHAFLTAELHNLYGPTEAAIDVTAWECRRPRPGEPERRAGAPIGFPIANLRIHLLDPAYAPVPPGAAAELYIGGAGLARGYLGRPDLTAERFVPDPLGPPGERLYRTGDLARRRPDGAVEYLGRTDHQVKRRGVRIEPAELEACLLAHAAVREAVVGLRPGPVLVAWVVPAEPGETPELPARLFAWLRERLPATHLPDAVVPVPALPRLPSGKVDRAALAAAAGAAGDGRARPALAPRTDLERRIAAVWREALPESAAPGAEDNFFELGGHSLLLPRIAGRLREETGREVSVVDLLRYPTVASLAGWMGDGEVRPGLQPRRNGGAPAGGEIAVVGMAARLPGAPDCASLWRNLCAGIESISVFAPDELRAAGTPVEILSRPGFVPAGGVLDEIDRFDAGFFGFSPREAELLDPQHRLFLECAWEALEHAGHAGGTDGPVGVYAGAGFNTYLVRHVLPARLGDRAAADIQSLVANDKDFLATRVAYKLGLEGPAVTVQTACSTSLVAIHLACQGLLAGDCDLALAGGVAVRTPHRAGYLFEEGGITSPDGHCRAFDAAAQGTVPGNGVGVVVLRRLADARAAGDTIHAVIRGSAINNDGALKAGYTAPRLDGQVGVIRAALARAGVEPSTISYVEAHGTGTPLGDPIELQALCEAFRPASGGPGSCALGSIKTNVGHLDAAAGVAGFLKAVLALRHRQIPPHLHFERLNPRCEVADSPFRVPTALEAWPAGETPRRAGVSSFGIGGTNAHVVLEEAPAPPPAAPAAEWQLLVLSARSPAALERASAALARHLAADGETPLADVAYTLRHGRRALAYRRAVVCRSREEAVQALSGSLPEPYDEAAQPLLAIGRRWAAGGEVDWRSFDPDIGGMGRRRVPLPTYPFERDRYWIEAPRDEGTEGVPRKRSDVAEWLYLPSWRRLPLRPAYDGAPAARRWLILPDREGLAAALAERLRVAGHSVTVAPPPAEGDWSAFLAQAESAGPLEAVAHLEGFVRTPGADPVARLLPLARAVAHRGRPLDLIVVASHLHPVESGDVAWPEQAPLVGLCRTLGQELPYLRCRTVDPGAPDGAAGLGALADRLAAELAGCGEELAVAWRGDNRWVESYEPAPLPPSPAMAGLRPGGVYLLLGGQTGVGACLATHLARAVRARLVLVGRTALPPRGEWPRLLAAVNGSGDGTTVAERIATVWRLEQLGAEVEVLAADVTDAAQLAAVLRRIEERFGALHGVVHTAGVRVLATVETLTPADWDRQLAPKVRGLRALDEALGGRPLDFCFVMSSLSAVLGVLGQPAYAAAHSFADAFCRERSRRGGTPWIAVDWDAWATGSALARAARGPEAELYMSPDEGAEVFARLLAHAPAWGAEHWVVSTVDLEERIRRWVRWRPRVPALSAPAEEVPVRAAHPRPPLATAYVPPGDETEAVLAGIWQDLLGIEPVGIHDNLFDLGGDSVTGLQIAGRAARHGLRLTPRQLFEHQTIAELARVAVRAEAAAGSGPHEGEVPLTPIQRWFFAQERVAPHHFNQAVWLEAAPGLTPQRVAASLARLPGVHAALRLRFIRERDAWRQRHAAAAGAFPCLRVDLSALPAVRRAAARAAIAAAAQTGFDLAAGPLARAAWVEAAGEPAGLFLAVHHLVIDAVSWRILLKDLEDLCRGGDPAPAPSFQEWAERLEAAARDGWFAADLARWQAVAGGAPAPLPRDTGAFAASPGAAHTAAVALGAEETADLLRVLRETRGDLQEVLVAALVRTLATWSGAPRVRIDLEGLGREPVITGVDLSRTVGWLTALFPVGFDLDPGRGPAADLAAVRATLRAVPGHGISWGVLRHLAASPPAGLPEGSEVVFVYLGRLEPRRSEAQLLVPTGEPCGPASDPRDGRPHALEVACRLEGDRLWAEWTGSAALYRRETVERLAREFLTALRKLLAAGLAEEAAEHLEPPAPPAFAAARLSQADLARVLAALQRQPGSR